MHKKLLSLLLICLLMLPCAPALAETDETLTCGDYEYSLNDDGTATITGYTGRKAVLRIPKTLFGYRVTAIGDRAFYSCNSLIAVTIPDSVTSIGEFAFCSCESLTSISLPDSLTSIGDQAFRLCALTSISLPQNITSIGDWTFYCCQSLTSISIPDNLTSIGNGAFSWCNSLTSISIPDNVTSIGNYAFEECSSLTSISLPDSLTSIGNNPFKGCRKLKEIIISSDNATLETIDGALFEKESKKLVCYPSALEAASYTVPQGTQAIGKAAFFNCNSLTSISLPKSLTSIGDIAFWGCPNLTLTVPRGSYAEQYAMENDIPYVYSEEPESEAAPSDYSYTLNDDGTATITEYQGEAESLIIPSELDGHFVTSIGDFAFGYCESLRSITIPDSVTSIGTDAFAFCSLLKSVAIPNSVTSIGDCAFGYCESLRSINIPDSVVSIDVNPFRRCYNLTQIVVSASHPTLATIDGVLFDKSSRTLICYPCALTAESYSIPQGTLSIGDSAFFSCNSLTDVTIPDSVTSIGIESFAFCNLLKSVTIPNSVTSIGSNPFFSCNQLTQLTVSPDHPTLEIIDGVLFDKASRTLIFYPCNSPAESYSVPQGTHAIADYAFFSCDNLTSVTFPDSLISIGKQAFSYCHSLASITIPTGAASIGIRAFGGCDSLTGVTIPESITSISYWAFDDCPNLTLTIPKGSYAEQYAVENDIPYVYSEEPDDQAAPSDDSSALNSPVAPVITQQTGNYVYALNGDGTAAITEYLGNEAVLTVPQELDGHPVTAIERKAFDVHTSLTSISLPDGLTSIGELAFYGCESLSSVSLPDSLTSIGNAAFYGCYSLTGISIPNSVTHIGANPFRQCNALTQITVSSDHPTLATIDGVLFEKPTKTLICYPCAFNQGFYAVPQNIQAIGNYAFSFCESLTSVSIPDSVTSIGNGAFSYCFSLSSISIPENVASIGNGTFSYCFSLTSFSVPKGVTSIGDSAFYWCDALTSVTIPESVSSIGEDAFGNCPSLTLTVPRDSYAAEYARSAGIPYTYVHSTDWLNG